MISWKTWNSEVHFPFLIAICIGGIMGMPHILIPHWLPAEKVYTPLVWRNVDDITYDETFYAIPVREMMDGNWLPGDSQLWEHRFAPAAFGILPYWFFAGIGRLIDSSSAAFIFGDFFLPPIMFLLLFGFARRLVDWRLSAIWAAMLVLGSYQLYALPLYFPNLDRWLTLFDAHKNYEPLGYYVRFLSMQATGPLFMASLWALAVLLKKGDKTSIVASAFFIASAFYSYFYSYTLWPPMLTVLFVTLWLKRDFSAAKQLFIAGGLAAFLALPFVFQFLQFQQSSYYADFFNKLGWSNDFNPKLTLITFGLVILAALNLRRGAVSERVLVFASLVAVLLLGSQQWYLGRALFPYHYYLLAGLPLSGVIALDSISGFVSLFLRPRHIWQKTKILDVLSVSATVITLAWATGYVSVYAKRNVHNFFLTKATQEAFDFLNASTPVGSVVASFSLETGTLVSVHTHNSVYIPNTCPMCTVASDDEIIDRVGALAALQGVPEAWLKRPFSQKRWLPFVFPEKDRPEFEAQVWGFSLFFYRFFFQPEQPAPAEFLESIRARYSWWQTQPREKILGAYCLNYVWVDNYERSISTIDLGRDPNFRLIYNTNEISVYQLIHPNCR